MKSRPEPGQEPGAPRWAGLTVSEGSAPGGSQGKAGVSWVRAGVSAREPEISPKRPRCLLEVRRTITPRCGPGLAAGGLWGRLAGTRVWVGAARGARAELLAGLQGCSRALGVTSCFHFLLQTPNPRPPPCPPVRKRGLSTPGVGEPAIPASGNGGEGPLQPTSCCRSSPSHWSPGHDSSQPVLRPKVPPA